MGIMVREIRAQESALMEQRRPGDVTSFCQLLPEPQLPSGWEKCLDLKSGLIYFKDWNSGTLTYRDPRRSVPATAQRIGLLSIFTTKNSPSTNPPLDEHSLELSLTLPGTPSTSKPASSQESSVCTMEKVRSALERSHWVNPRKRASPSLESTTSRFHLDSSSSSQCSLDSECFTSPSVMSYQGDDEVEVQQPRDCRGAGAKSQPVKKQQEEEEEEEEDEIMVTVGCRRCLMFVMLSKSHPCCPKCGSTDHVLLQLPAPLPKRQRHVTLASPSWSWSTA